MQLTQLLEEDRYETFCQNVARGMTGLAAYEAAGFHTNNYASTAAGAGRLLARPEIRRRIRELQEPRLREGRNSVERLVEEYCRLAYSNMDDYLVVGDDGQPRFDYAATTRAQRAAIAEVTVEEFLDGRGADARQVRRVRFKMHDKQAAMSDLGKFLRMFRDERDVNVNVTMSLAALISESMAPRAVAPPTIELRANDAPAAPGFDALLSETQNKQR